MSKEELCKIFQDFIDQYIEGLTVICDGTDWYYDMFNETINISLNTDEKTDKLFNQVCNNLGLNWDCPMFIMSFLHEAFHHYTIDMCDEFEWNLVDIFVTLKGIVCENIIDNDYYTYFYSPRERMATEWACDFANEHRVELEDLWKNISGK